jgi:hypothetical protein
MKNNKGQTAVEMVFVLPLLVILAGGMLFMVYAGWQDLKIQQAANLLARVEGQEKVSGGTSIRDINIENGFGPGTGFQDGDDSVSGRNFGVSDDTHVTSGGAFALSDRMKNLLRGFFPGGLGKGGGMAQPRAGQNVDQITITRVIPTFRIPFTKRNAGMPKEITLKGTAYGGEDPYMYALPRWGTTPTSGRVPEWRRLLRSAKDPNHQSPD